jgi:hypothetical protein
MTDLKISSSCCGFGESNGVEGFGWGLSTI